MTTDELRTWMRALEERDVRIAKLEKAQAETQALLVALGARVAGGVRVEPVADIKAEIRAAAKRMPPNVAGPYSWEEALAPHTDCPVCGLAEDPDSGLCAESCYHKRPLRYARLSGAK